MRIFSYVLLCCVLVGAMACADGERTVVTSDLSPERDTSTNDRQLWGLYDICIDTETLEATVVPNRTTMVRLNVNNFMNMNPMLLGLSIVDASKLISSGELTLDVDLTHPLATKPKLAGLDVHAVLISNGANNLVYDTDMSVPVIGTDTVLLNPDGYTRWYNAVEFTTPGLFGYVPGILGNIPEPTATVNGYKLYADNLGVTGNAASWLSSHQADRALFSAGTTNSRRFQLQFALSGGKPVVRFQYAVVASWDKPTSDDPGPGDFPLTANIQEASHLRIDISDSTLFYTPIIDGGDLVIQLDIFDWQGGDNIAAEVVNIYVDSEVLTVPYEAGSPVITQVPGEAFASWTVTIPVDNVTSTDDVPVWVIVESETPTDYNNGVGANYPIGKPLAAVQKAMVTVDDESPYLPPTIFTGIDILSGTSRCPDRSIDSSAILDVVAAGDLPITYSWTITQIKNPGPLPGWDGVPGDGNGKLFIDFTDPVFANATESLIVHCQVSDGINPAVHAGSLSLFLDCLIFHADMNDLIHPDNTGWWVFDETGTTAWATIGNTDAGTKLTGTGALFQNGTGGVDANSQGALRSTPVVGYSGFSSMIMEVDHSYAFTGGLIGGNIKITDTLGTPSVGGEPSEIVSGDAYDIELTDDTSELYPHWAFSLDNIPSPLFTSRIEVPEVLASTGFVVVFQVDTTDSNSMADGGWLIDDVRVIGQL